MEPWKRGTGARFLSWPWEKSPKSYGNWWVLMVHTGRSVFQMDDLGVPPILDHFRKPDGDFMEFSDENVE